MTTSCREIDYSELRGMIKSRVGTEGKFAELIGRTHAFVSSVFNNKAYFDTDDIVKACDVLDVKSEDVGFLFFTKKVHISEQE